MAEADSAWATRHENEQNALIEDVKVNVGRPGSDSNPWLSIEEVESPWNTKC
jgi:hypothetical protein